MCREEIISNEEMQAYMIERFPFYNNDMLARLIKKEFGVQIESSDVVQAVRYLREHTEVEIENKYPICLRKTLLHKKGWPVDDTDTPDMTLMKVNVDTVIDRLDMLVESIKEKCGKTVISNCVGETVFVNCHDMGGKCATIIVYLVKEGILTNKTHKNSPDYKVDIHKLLRLRYNLKKRKTKYVQPYKKEGNGGSNNEL